MNGGMPGIFHQPCDSLPIRAATPRDRTTAPHWQSFEPAVLTDRQAEQARTAARAMARAFDLGVERQHAAAISVEVESDSPSGSKSQRVLVPLPALRLFVQLLSELASGTL